MPACAEVVDPLLNYKKQNKFIAMGAERYSKDVHLGMKNIFQDGYMAGQMPSNPWERLIELVLAHDYYLSVTQDPESLEYARAQAALMEEQKLMRRLISEPLTET